MFWDKVTVDGWKKLHAKPQAALIASKGKESRRRERQAHLVLRDSWSAVTLKGWGAYAEAARWGPAACQRWEERPVVMLPASWLLKGFSRGKWANVGHWLGEVVAPARARERGSPRPPRRTTAAG
eukprot:gene3191-21277_t